MACVWATAHGQPTSIAEAMRLAREAGAAAQADDHATRVAKLTQAVELRPDLPQLLVDLAMAQVASEQRDEAVATLRQLASTGVSVPIASVEGFAALRSHKEYQALVKLFAVNQQPKGMGEIAFILRDVTGLMEGIAWSEGTGAFYFGDVNGRAVWRRAKDGKLQRLTAEGDELLGVFGLAIDDANGALWAATSAVPAMRDYTAEQEGMAALAEIDLSSGAVRRVIPVPSRGSQRPMHMLNDLAIGPDGTIYVTDSGEPVLWKLVPGRGALEVAAQSPEFLSLQGIVVLPDNTAVVADQVNGLLRVDLGKRQVQRMEPPADTVLIGLDGLALNATGAILAVQNGTRPPRVLRIVLDEGAEAVSRVSVLEAGHLAMPAPSLGCIATGGDFFYIGNAGWNRFAADDGRPTAPRSVPVYRTKVPKR